MAGLNRDFLMPYLQNICSLHLVLRKIEQKKRKINYLIFETENTPEVEPPQRKEHISEKNGVYYSFTALGSVMVAFCAMLVALNIKEGTRFALPWAAAGIAGGVVLLVLARLLVHLRRKANGRTDTDYTRAYEQYCCAMHQAAEQKTGAITKLKQRFQALEEQNKQVSNLLQMAYDVDLIPAAYRNIYCAVYLYEWICSSRSEDLSVALEAFNPEVEKVKLEPVIANQTNAILVHAQTASVQYRTPTMQKQQEKLLRVKASNLASNAQELDIYNAIADVNVAAGAFFAVGDHLT